jgi:hypothetical protein
LRGIEFAQQVTEAFGWNIFDVVYNRQG